MKTFKVTFNVGLRDDQLSLETVSSVTAWIEQAIEQQLERGETLHPVIVKDVTDSPTGTDLQTMCKTILGVQS